MTIKKKIYGAAALVVLAGGMLFANEQASRPQRRLDFLASKLDLTDAQKQSAQSIFAQSREAAKPVIEQLKQGHEAMAAAIKAGKSEAELTQIATQQGALVGQLSAIHAKAFSQLYAQLTPDQKVKADQLHQGMKGSWRHHRGSEHTEKPLG
jgi:Spy/CpxP family protein refolding chaperone